MLINSVNSRLLSFSASLNKRTKNELNNKQFIKELESQISGSKVLNNFDDNYVINIEKTHEDNGWDDEKDWLETVITGNLKGQKVSAVLKSRYRYPFSVNAGESVPSRVGENKCFQSQVLNSVKNADIISIKAQMAKQYVENYMKDISDEEAAIIYDNIKNN